MLNIYSLPSVINTFFGNLRKNKNKKQKTKQKTKNKKQKQKQKPNKQTKKKKPRKKVKNSPLKICTRDVKCISRKGYQSSNVREVVIMDSLIKVMHSFTTLLH